ARRGRVGRDAQEAGVVRIRAQEERVGAEVVLAPSEAVARRVGQQAGERALGARSEEERRRIGDRAVGRVAVPEDGVVALEGGARRRGLAPRPERSPVVVLDAGRVAAQRHASPAAVVGVVADVVGAGVSAGAVLDAVAVARGLDRRHEEVVPDVGVVAGVPQLGIGAVLLGIVVGGVVGDAAVRIAQEERYAAALVAVDRVVADVDARRRPAPIDDDATAFGRRRAVALVGRTPAQTAADRLAGEPGCALIVV